MNETYYSGINIRVENFPNGVKKMIFTRTDRHNSFNEGMIKEILTILTKLSSIQNENDMRLLIIEGSGKTFCAGADLAYMKEQSKKNEEQNLEDALTLGQMFFKLASFPCPVISVVQGAAIGGGLGIVACSDFTIAEENSIFATSEVLLGIVPGVISPYVIRKVGIANASFLLLSGKKILALECKELGFINKVTKIEHIQQELQNTIDCFLMAGPLAARRTKNLILNAAPLPDSEQLNFTAKQIAIARASKEGKAGIQSFFEKTPPYWQHGATK